MRKYVIYLQQLPVDVTRVRLVKNMLQLLMKIRLEALVVFKYQNALMVVLNHILPYEIVAEKAPDFSHGYRTLRVRIRVSVQHLHSKVG